MDTKIITTTVKALSDAELSPADSALVEEARRSTFRSYAPYSRFSVGAAILLDNGTIVCGSNQENAAYPSGMCAERTAAYYAHSRWPEAKFVKIAIAARDTGGKPTACPISPCGACRQALIEYESLSGHPVEVLMAGADAVYVIHSIADLLPLAFTEFD